ncbi:hypothetical protein [Hamadaea tsunoensis]|uniref:hypothetical protein n=1 Tax=Hamadaea tsunoensis TaxID=53368 RepID=UPI000406ED57|nr:hypothetical protein [Hamadaea tsunoensis]
MIRLSDRARLLLTGYLLPAGLTVAACTQWFGGGRYIASGDVAPYVRDGLGSELASLWNHQSVPTGSPSYAVTAAPDVLLLRLAGLVGLPGPAAQFLAYAIVFAFAALGASHLAATWVRRPWPVAYAGTFGAVNAYVLVNHPNLLPVLAIGLAGLLAGQLLRAARGDEVRAAPLALLTVATAYLAQNPPLVLIVALVAVACPAVGALCWGRPALRRTGRLILRAVPLAIVLNLWWLVPYAVTLTDPGDGLRFTAQTDVALWAWTHVRASFANVLTLNAHWGWDYPEYFPYAKLLDAGWWAWLRWIPAALAIAGAVSGLADRRTAPRRANLVLAVVLLLVAVFATGTHAPFGPVNLWIFEHVPGAWLLREPMSKLGVVMVLGYGVLGARALAWLADTVPPRFATPATAWRSLAADTALPLAVLSAVAAVAYPWPLWTGAVVPQTRTGLPGSRVAVPADWHRIADIVNKAPDQGRVLVLPVNDYYQVTTSWGYHGVDQIPVQLLRRPALQLLPGGYFDAQPAVGALVNAVQDDLLAGDFTGAYAALGRLGVGHVIVRSDVTPALAAPKMLPQRLSDALSRLPGSELEARYAVADAYRTTAADSPVRVAQRFAQVHADTTGRALLGLPADTAIVGTGGGSASADSGPRGAQGNVAASLADGSTAGFGDGGEDAGLLRGGVWAIDGQAGTGTIDLPRAGAVTLNRPAATDPVYWARTTGKTLRLTDAEKVTVDGRALPARPPLTIRLRTPGAVALAVNGLPQPLPAAGTPVRIGAATTVGAYAPVPHGTTQVRFGPLGDCARGAADPRLSMTRPDPRTLQLAASADAACVSGPVRSVAGAAAYRVRLDVRSVSGAPPRICLWRDDTGCVTTDQPAYTPGDGWRQFQTVALLAPSASPMQLFLYADGAGTRTVVQYRNVRVDGLALTGRATLTGQAAPSSTLRLPAGRHQVTFGAELAGQSLGAFSALQDCFADGKADQGRAYSIVDGAMRLAARTGTACVRAGILGTIVAGTYQIKLDYRTATGQPPRICVWQEGPDRCAPTPALTRSTGWQHLDTTLRVEPGTRHLFLYLYADGGAADTTTVEYRAPILRPSLSTVLVAAQTDTIGPTSTTTVTPMAARPDRFQVRVRELGGTRVLVLADSYADGWHLDGLPAGWKATHVVADGYANGWILTGDGDATLTLTYQPATLGYLAQLASATAALWLLVAGLVRRVRRRVP